jgi:RimJ/RimL family protein N-acetyltransferase
VTAVFATDRLRVVPWRADHAEAAHAAYSRSDFVQYLGNPTPHRDLDQTHEWIRRIAAMPSEDGHGFWAVERTDTGEVVGATLVQPLPDGDSDWEIGWHVFPAHQRQGYATEIGRGAAAYAFEVVGLQEVYAVVRPENTASLGVARAVGMTSLGRTDRHYGVTAELFVLRASPS